MCFFALDMPYYKEGKIVGELVFCEFMIKKERVI